MSETHSKRTALPCALNFNSARSSAKNSFGSAGPFGKIMTGPCVKLIDVETKKETILQLEDDQRIDYAKLLK